MKRYTVQYRRHDATGVFEQHQLLMAQDEAQAIARSHFRDEVRARLPGDAENGKARSDDGYTVVTAKRGW